MGPMQTKKGYTEPLSTNDYRGDWEDEDPMQYGSWEDEDPIHFMRLVKKTRRSKMPPSLGGEVAKERSGQKGKVDVNKKGRDCPVVGKGPRAKTEEHAAAKIQKVAEQQRDPDGEVAKERSEQKGKAATNKMGKDCPVVGKGP